VTRQVAALDSREFGGFGLGRHSPHRVAIAPEPLRGERTPPGGRHEEVSARASGNENDASPSRSRRCWSVLSRLPRQITTNPTALLVGP
jgi:hypothetical protein